jgi:hypothetical protein
MPIGSTNCLTRTRLSAQKKGVPEGTPGLGKQNGLFLLAFGWLRASADCGNGSEHAPIFRNDASGIPAQIRVHHWPCERCSSWHLPSRDSTPRAFRAPRAGKGRNRVTDRAARVQSAIPLVKQEGINS